MLSKALGNRLLKQASKQPSNSLQAMFTQARKQLQTAFKQASKQPSNKQASSQTSKQGVLVPMQIASWVSAILDLAAAQEQRASILRAASGTIHELEYAARRQNFEQNAAHQEYEPTAPHQLIALEKHPGQCNVS